MSCSSGHFLLANLTTVENLAKKRRAWQLAVLIPPSYVIPKEEHYPHITYPLPNNSGTKTASSVISPPMTADSESRIVLENAPLDLPSERDARAIRRFAILEMQIGRNPFDLGAVENWKSVMGHSILDMILPIKHSPSSNHEDPESHFPVGRWVEQLKVDVGFMSPQDMCKPRSFAGYGKGQKKTTEGALEMRRGRANPLTTAEATSQI
jgi:palmitoyltransferase